MLLAVRHRRCVMMGFWPWEHCVYRPLHCPVDLPLGVLFGRVVALVIELFALGQRDLDLGQRTAEIDRQGNQRISVLPYLAEQAHDLALVHQQTAGPQRVLVKNIALLIGRDVHLPDVELPVLDLAPGLLEAQRAEADGLYFGAGQLDPGLKLFFNEVFVVCLLVFRHDLDAASCHLRTFFASSVYFIIA